MAGNADTTDKPPLPEPAAGERKPLPAAAQRALAEAEARGAEAIRTVLAEGMVQAMNHFNRNDASPGASP